MILGMDDGKECYFEAVSTGLKYRPIVIVTKLILENFV